MAKEKPLVLRLVVLRDHTQEWWIKHIIYGPPIPVFTLFGPYSREHAEGMAEEMRLSGLYHPDRIELDHRPVA